MQVCPSSATFGTMSRRVIVITAMLALIAFGAWWFSPAERIKRRVHAMIDAAAVPATMGNLSRSTRGHDVAKFFAPSLEIVSSDSLRDDVPAEIRRDEAASLYAGVARHVREVSLVDPEITRLDIAGDSAEVDFIVDAIVQLSNRRPIDGMLHTRTRWTRDPEHGWVMARIEWVESPR